MADASAPVDGPDEAADEAQALERMTDVVEEQELDAARAKEAAEAVAAAEAEEAEAHRARERELAAVNIDRSNLAVIADEFLVDKAVAERRLREHGGDVVKAMRSFL